MRTPKDSVRQLLKAAVVALLFFGLDSPLRAQPQPWWTKLNEWRFDDYNLLTVNTGTPQAALGFTLVSSFDTNALRLTGNDFALVQYPIFETSGRTNLICDFGSVRFWYRPLWSSTTSGGSGPGDYARLLEVGLWTASGNYGWWSIYLNPSGTRLSFGGQADGQSAEYVQATTDWESNRWYQVVVTYSPSNSFLYLDGQLAASGAGATLFASLTVQTQTGLTIGGTAIGESLMQGDLDVLETFNYQLSAATVSNSYWNPNPSSGGGGGGPSGGSGGSPGPPGAGGACTNCTNFFLPFKTAYDGLTNSTNLWIEIRFGSNGTSTLVLHNTGGGTNYQLLARSALGSNAQWAVIQDLIGAENTNCTVTTIGTDLLPAQFLVFGESEDSDGDGLPNVWEALVSMTSVTNADTGDTGIPDGYKDPDGDGWTHLDELRNGTNPLQFNTPAPPQNVQARFTGTNVLITWEAARGPVLGYRISEARSGAVLGTVSSNVFSFTDEETPEWLLADPFFDQDRYRIEAIYEDGDSFFSEYDDVWEPRLSVTAWLVRGTNGQLFLCVGDWAEDIVAVRITSNDGASWEISRTNFQNGVYRVAEPIPKLGVRIQGLGGEGTSGTPTFLKVFIESSTNFPISQLANLQQVLSDNLRFLLRAATVTNPFTYSAFYNLNDGNVLSSRSFTSDQYEFSGFHWYENAIFPKTRFDPVRSLEENFLWRNFVFDSNLFTTNGGFLTGARTARGYFGAAREIVGPMFRYGGTNSLSQLAPDQTPSVFYSKGSETRWHCFDEWGEEFPCPEPPPNPYLAEAGMYEQSLTSPPRLNWILSNNVLNVWGLPIDSVQVVTRRDPNLFVNVGPGQAVDVINYGGTIFPNVRQPTFGVDDYYFCRRTNAVGWGFSPPMPGQPDFSPTNATPLLITSVAQPLYISGWAKKRILNGNTNKFAYLVQFFDKALKADANGNATTNETGILSEYGEFFPTEPGLTILRTMPDIETSEVGQAFLHVISVNVDANHDGVMDLTFGGPDRTSAQKPFVFWVNDDMDRGHEVDCDAIGQNCDWEEDDVTSDASVSGVPESWRTPDHSFVSAVGVSEIPSQRDLEDYGRLHIPGLSNLLATVPTNYTVELAMRNVGADAPAIRLFRAVEADGGDRYLFDENVANQQKTLLYAPYVGVVAPGLPIDLTARFRSASSAIFKPGDYYIFCGQSRGRGELVLQVKRDGQVIAEASAFIHFKKIQEMYERWTVGDAPTVAPLPVHMNASEDLPKDVPPFHYPHNGGSDTNLPYVLFVHGWNLEQWEKDRFAEAAFKRLYWQGYQGRFGLFRWPTYNKFDAYNWFGQNPATSPNHFDNSEFNAWRSGEGLRRLLVSLNRKYPGNVRLFSHSMGSIVAGQALRTNTTLVAVYAAMQSALPSGAYDFAAPYREIPFENDGTPELYRLYCETTPAEPYFHEVAGAAAYINFYNPVDWALDWWEFDQNLKPTDTLDYSYEAATSQFFRHRGTAAERLLTCPTNTFELFSYGVESQCYALGQQAGVDGVFDPTREVRLDPEFNFGSAHKGHSAQFRSTNMKRAGFWTVLLEEFGLR